MGSEVIEMACNFGEGNDRCVWILGPVVPRYVRQTVRRLSSEYLNTYISYDIPSVRWNRFTVNDKPGSLYNGVNREAFSAAWHCGLACNRR